MSRGLIFLSMLSPTILKVGRELEVGAKDCSGPKISDTDKSDEELPCMSLGDDNVDEDDAGENSGGDGASVDEESSLESLSKGFWLSLDVRITSPSTRSPLSISPSEDIVHVSCCVSGTDSSYRQIHDLIIR